MATFKYPVDGISKSSTPMVIYQTTIIFVLVIFTLLFPFFATALTLIEAFCIEGFAIFATLVLSGGIIGSILTSSDVLLDENGIAWSRFGKVWRRYKWSDLKRVRIISKPFVSRRNLFNMDTRANVYCFDVVEHPRTFGFIHGTIAVTETIGEIKDLLRIADRHVSECGTEILDLRSDAPIHRAHLS